MKSDKIKKDALDNFLKNSDTNEELEKQKESIITERSGLIERVDKIFVTNDGRQLLREQY